MAKTKSDITLYTVGTPNGIKVSILLEELNLDYKVHTISFKDNEQKAPWFLEINPNGRIPALTDKTEDGKTIRVFESGAILQYLVARYDEEHKLSFPTDTPEHWEMTSWLMWQMGGLGPMQGQANHFFRYAPEKIQYGIDRYINETRRLYRTLDTHLEKQPSGYIVGGKCTIADIASWGWVAGAAGCNVDINEFPHLKKWVYQCLERPGFEAGRHVPTKHTALDAASKSAEELERETAASIAWVQKGMQDDKK
ncbi:glutathione S-transferase [Geosmithia morbida]|uniref:Glutathione S-transferase n=1 Tax=Geosmithia morbida TaxID=1094350 RepID=A0A9P4YSA4_9HYPO|nr:glutathione S-transferase [Geosmithia morbida]KAF4121845.1 glutathione S-transferase [Geosmithia morbida]